jgi:hypothetical protein
MKRLVDLVKLDRLDQAIGTPEQLSKRVGLSRSSLFDFIAFLRDEMRAPIRYSKCLHLNLSQKMDLDEAVRMAQYQVKERFNSIKLEPVLT